jgi:hypothetical protein
LLTAFELFPNVAEESQNVPKLLLTAFQEFRTAFEELLTAFELFPNVAEEFLNVPKLLLTVFQKL